MEVLERLSMPPNTSYKCVVLSSAWFSFLSSSLVRFLAPSILPTLSQVFQLSGACAGIVAASYWTGYAIFQIPAGAVTDIYGSRRTLLTGGALAALLTFVAAQSQEYFQLVLTQFLLGSACAFIWPPAMTLLLDWFDTRERATASFF